MPKKVKWYAYDLETGQYIPPSKLNSYGVEGYTICRTPPKIRKQRQELYNEGWAGLDKTNTGDYQDAVRYGTYGGRPPKWKSDQESV